MRYVYRSIERFMYVGMAVFTSPQWFLHVFEYIVPSFLLLPDMLLLCAVMNSSLSVHIRCTVRSPSGDLTFRTLYLWNPTGTRRQMSTWNSSHPGERHPSQAPEKARTAMLVKCLPRIGLFLTTSWWIRDLWKIFDIFNV